MISCLFPLHTHFHTPGYPLSLYLSVVSDCRLPKQLGRCSSCRSSHKRHRQRISVRKASTCHTTHTYTHTQAHSHTGYRRNASLSLSLSLPPASHQLPLRFNFTRSYFPYTLSAYMCDCVCVCVLVSVSGSCPELMYNLRRKFIFKLLPLAVSFRPKRRSSASLYVHTQTRRQRSLRAGELLCGSRALYLRLRAALSCSTQFGALLSHSLSSTLCVSHFIRSAWGLGAT